MDWSFPRGGARGFVLAMLLAVTGASPGHADTLFDTLAGTWSGTGQIRLDNGKSESLRCNAYYTQKESNGLGLSIRCANAGNKIELRANLTQERGDVDGSWEERTYNAAGTVKGKMTPSRINLSISGGSFSGSMNVSVLGARHSVSIETNGIGLRGVSIVLSRG